MYNHSPEQAVIAAELARQLQDYDARLRELLEGHWDPQLYRALCDQFDAMQMQAQLLPRVSLAWTELLISRVELVQALWAFPVPSRINGRVVACHAQHRAALQEALHQCRHYALQAAPRFA